jgi:alpha-L-fucosidase 2
MKRDSYVLFEKKEAAAFEESYLLGNGTLGAAVFGSPTSERIILNHDTLWSGFPRKNVFRGKGKAALDKVKALVKEKRYAEADECLSAEFASYSSDAYLPMGEIWIDFLDTGDKVSAYKRELDLSTATVNVSYRKGGAKYRARAYVSHPDKGFVYKISCTGGTFSLSVGMSTKLYGRVFTEGNTVCVDGEAYVASEKNIERTDRKRMYSDEPSERGMRYFVALAVLTDGKTINGGDSLTVKNASYAELRLCAETSYNGFDKHPYLEGKPYSVQCRAMLDELLAKDEFDIYRRHKRDYARFYSRVSLDLQSSSKSSLPTSRRLELYSEGKEDKALPALLFNFGRYLTIASSREGSQAINLQGIWNPHFFAPWHSNYTVNINTEMNYFPTLSISLPEMFEPFIRLVKEISVTGRDSAKYFYGADGWVCHHNTDLWRHTHPVAGGAVFSFWNASGAWFCHHLYEYYEYTRDEKFLLETAYPIMREAVRFYLSELSDSDDGYRIVYPSTSPENRFISEGKMVSVSESSEMTMSCVRELFGNYLKICDSFSLSDDILDRVRSEYPRLRPIMIGSDGRVLEWYGEQEENQKTHRHLSHLYALYPSSEISASNNTALLDAARRSLEVRGDEGTGWSLAWKCNLYARLFDGDHAFSLIKQQLRPSSVYGSISMVGGGTYPNMTCAHPPFQIDGNFGVTAGICEMLLKSDMDCVHLLPALPSEWRDLSVKGLSAKGKRSISLKISDGVLVECRISGEPPNKIYVASRDVTELFKGESDATLLCHEIKLK